MRIFAVHLLNDYSGSPKVLMQLVQAWQKENIAISLLTNKHSSGFLSHLKALKRFSFFYTFKNNKFLRLIYFLLAQIQIFFIVLFKATNKDIVYINTVLPFGAAIAGACKRSRVVYHIHETSLRPFVLKWFLFKVVSLTADDVIYVSKFLAKKEALPKLRSHILPNCIEDTFLVKAKAFKKTRSEKQNVLMVCSLKEYKGLNEFVLLAKENTDFSFKLVLNATADEIEDYFEPFSLSSNLTLVSKQKNLHPFYEWADVILNLSPPSKLEETFGLTIIEGMSYCLPAIVPPVGGIAELVDDGVNGFQVDSSDSEKLNKALRDILRNRDLYEKMSSNAAKRIKNYSEAEFVQKNLSILNLSKIN